MFETLTFHAPYFLLLLPLFILLNTMKKENTTAFYMPHTRYYDPKKTSSSFLQTLIKWLKYLMVLFAVVALSDPIQYKNTATTKSESIDIVLALDTSGSMSLYGFNPKAYNQTRLDVVKKVLSSFMKQRTNDRIGLVIFGTHAAVASPLSFDKKSQTYMIDKLKIGALGKSTALVDAIVASVKLLKKSKSRSKVIILLSDGEDSSSIVPLPIALKLAQKHDIKVYTILIDKTHSDMMQIIAKASQTKPYNPKNETALKEVYTQIDQLEKSKTTYQQITVPQHLYAYFLSFSLLCGFTLLFLAKKEEIL